MTQDRATSHDNEETRASRQKVVATSYYGLLGLHPSASVREIRQAYRDLSKRYHPDTTSLSAAIATAKFQQLNEAYATLSSPEQRTIYDRTVGYSATTVVQRSQRFEQPRASTRVQSSSAYLDPTDRPLSPGEIFALFILGLTFVGCLVLAIAIGVTRGEAVLQPITAYTRVPQPEITTVEPGTSDRPATPQIDIPVAEADPPLPDPVPPS